jgi:hypothetical protein
MQFQIPPAIIYAFGAMLVVFGVVRAYHLGWKQRPDPDEAGGEVDEKAGDEGDEEDRPRAAPSTAHRRHLRWGIAYVAMGLFLIVSTLWSARGR